MPLHMLRNIKLRYRYGKKQRKAMKEWLANGKPNPPPHQIKRENINEHAKKYGLKLFVETGTYHGDMIDLLRNDFDQLYSIELSDQYFKDAERRFKCQKHIKILHGDSGEKLGELVPQLKTPALFWLDGHYSAGNTAKGVEDTPILRELAHIFSSPVKGHVILVDDARLFGSDPGYPSLETVKSHVLALSPGSNIVLKDDSICITPGR